MPFINDSSRREKMQGMVEYDPVARASFGETFAASLGQVVDEELSVSSMMHHEALGARNQQILDKIKAGEIGEEDARPGKAGIEFGRIAERLKDPAIKTDAQLQQERKEMLAMRRAYAQDVMERGGGMAQFLGAATGYMLDPINVATMGIGTPANAARATSTIGRIALASKNAAIVGGVTELGIQPLVYAHKKDIDSPYTVKDALANIAMSATGSAALGGLQGGLAGYFGRVKTLANELPQTEELKTALNYIERTEMALATAPKVEIDEQAITDAVLKDARDELLSIANNKQMLRDAQALEFENADLMQSLDGLDDAEIKAATPDQIKAFKQAEEELLQIDQGVIPERYQSQINQKIAEQKIKSDVAYLEELQNRAQEYASPSRKADQYDVTPEAKSDQAQKTESSMIKADQKQSASKKTQVEITEKPQGMTREQEFLTTQGIKDNFDAEMAAFDALENPIIRIGDENINAKELIASYDDEINGLDDVMRCVIG